MKSNGALLLFINASRTVVAHNHVSVDSYFRVLMKTRKEIVVAECLDRNHAFDISSPLVWQVAVKLFKVFSVVEMRLLVVSCGVACNVLYISISNLPRVLSFDG